MPAAHVGRVAPADRFMGRRRSLTSGACVRLMRSQEGHEKIDEMDRAELCDVCECRTADAGEYIYQLGDASDRLFFLLDGKLDLQTPVLSTKLLIGPAR
eukprot:4204247-Prymnesium_polylepis.3